jgi:hypothetical protein
VAQRLYASEVRRQWAVHALTCTKGAGTRGRVHDRITDIWVVLLQMAGFEDVRLEDAWWDANASYMDVDRRQPDITCQHPVTREKLVLDIVVYWGACVLMKVVERTFGFKGKSAMQRGS